MKLASFYTHVLSCGRDRDPRKNKAAIKSFSDSGILHGSPDREIRTMLVGIDIEAPELLLAERLRFDQGLDLVIAHHPEGRPFALLYEVMQLQVEVLTKAGVDADTAQQLMDERIWEVERRILANNHTRAVDVARLLDIPFVCIHTPADNHVFSYIRKLMDLRKPKRVRDIIAILMELEEYRQAARIGAGPRVILGNPRAEAGKILVDMTGGSEGHRDVFDKLYKAGIRTMVCMHLSEEHFKKAQEASMNIVIAGHIASDVLGLNLLLDRIETHAPEQSIV